MSNNRMAVVEEKKKCNRPWIRVRVELRRTNGQGPGRCGPKKKPTTMENRIADGGVDEWDLINDTPNPPGDGELTVRFPEPACSGNDNGPETGVKHNFCILSSPLLYPSDPFVPSCS